MWSKSTPGTTPQTTPTKPETKVQPSPLPRSDESVKIGKTVVVKGELTGQENLTIEGRVEGRIELPNHQLTIGPSGKVNAEIMAKIITVVGQVEGNVQATELVEIRESGSLLGDIRASRLVIADGANFKGSVDMAHSVAGAQKGMAERAPLSRKDERPPEPKPAVSFEAFKEYKK